MPQKILHKYSHGSQFKLLWNNAALSLTTHPWIKTCPYMNISCSDSSEFFVEKKKFYFKTSKWKKPTALNGEKQNTGFHLYSGTYIIQQPSF